MLERERERKGKREEEGEAKRGKEGRERERDRERRTRLFISYIFEIIQYPILELAIFFLWNLINLMSSRYST